MDAKNPRAEVYELNIVLLGAEPPIWRRFALPGAVNLADLHLAIQRVMGWWDSHLHEFTIADRSYGPHDASAGLGLEQEIADERKAKLCEVVAGAGSSFEYVYDLGDGWTHLLKVERVGEREPGARYPVCLAGERACPPEDCGGVPGYADLLVAIADPADEDHDDLLEWLGEEFDPEAFSLEEVNHRLIGAR